MSSSCSSEKSDSSTIVYDQEPFETYKTRVLKLCQTLAFFSDKEVSIERLAGGGFNKIIGISVHSARDSTESQYILRIPRFEAAQLSRDIAPLQLLSHRSDILAPKVVAFDTTSNNALESPYMIQQRIPGSDLFTTYPTTTHETKCAIARELGKVFFAMHTTRSTIAGNLLLSPDRGEMMIQSLHSTEIMMPYQDGPPTQTALEMLLASFENKKAMSVAKGPNDSFRVEFWDAFITITSQIGSLGVLEADFYYLCHPNC